jgi:hypothetical protein
MSHNDYHIAAEKDTSGKINRHIWYYFIGLGGLLFLTIYGLDIMYLFSVEKEKDEKIGSVLTLESINEGERVSSFLSGKKGLFAGKKHVAIDIAMDQVLSGFRQVR